MVAAAVAGAAVVVGVAEAVGVTAVVEAGVAAAGWATTSPVHPMKADEEGPAG